MLRRATTAWELEQCLRLCYDVFTREQGEQLFADHERRLYVDRFGTLEHPHLLALDADGRPAGTCRVVLRAAGPYVGDELFDWPFLAATVGSTEPELLRSVGIAGRMAVAAAARRRGLMRKLVEQLILEARDHGCGWLVATTGTENVASAGMLQDLGWERWGVGTTARGWQGVRWWTSVQGL